MNKWQRCRRLALAAGAIIIVLFVFASNSRLYLSHRRFPVLAYLQLTHSTNPKMRVEKPVVVGHRGLPVAATNPDLPVGSTIGNTHASIESATQSELVDWIEIDVRRTKDGELVLFHDADLKDKTKRLEGSVEEMDWKDLKQASLWVEEDTDTHILRLEQVLTEFSSPELKWILDIKLNKNSQDLTGDTQRIAADVVELVKKFRISHSNLLIFGDQHVLKAFRGSGYRFGYTTLYQSHRNILLCRSALFRRCQVNDCDLLVVPTVFVTPLFVQSAQARGISVWSYDSNESKDLQYCLNCGVEGLIVDDPRNAPHQ